VNKSRARGAGLIALVVGAAAVVAVLLLKDEGGGPGTITPCNGHAELCDRPLDRVAFAATHNSMSARSSPGWRFAAQEEGIPSQLAAGIRGLLVDAHYGYPGRRVFTEVNPDSAIRKRAVADLGPGAVAVADRVRAGISRPKGSERRIYLCHGFCELGATDLGQTFKQVDSFLDENRNEVLVLVFEDYVEPRDLVEEFERSGLEEHVFKGPAGPPWPTLREMIADDERVLVLAENKRGGADWYHPAFELMQETPYTFKRLSQMSCRPNRGASDNSLFLVNHWIDTSPSPRANIARVVNAFPFLLRRARTCERERQFPNLLAVDFYQQGDVQRVVDRLNGVK
jgi:hypothetical protein